MTAKARVPRVSNRLVRRGLPALLAFSLLTASGVARQNKSQANDDVVLAAMRAELDRSKSQLKMDPVAAPYYIEYRVFDLDQYSAEAAFGALRADVHLRYRVLRVVVRIGDYKQDSYSGQGQGTVDFMPLDNDMLALRHQLWLATDRAYKSAAESLTAKQAQLKQLTVDQPVDDFSHADPVQSLGPLATLEFDPEPWKRTIQDASAIYKGYPAIESFDSNFNFHAVNR
jgi:TldD protein